MIADDVTVDTSIRNEINYPWKLSHISHNLIAMFRIMAILGPILRFNLGLYQSNDDA